MTPKTDKALRWLIYTVVVYLWIPLLAGLAISITYVLWVAGGKDW